MKPIFKIFLPLTLSSVFIAVSCFPTDNRQESSEKSLDNFANGSLKNYNSCSGNRSSSAVAKDTLITASTNDARTAVEAALSAVPQELLRAFQAVSGKVVATRDAATICRQAAQNNSEKDAQTGATIPSCWLQEKAGVAPQIIVSDEPALIHHSMIRAFTYFFVEYFVARIKHPDAGITAQDPRWQSAISEFESQREAVTQAFLTDLASKDTPAVRALKDAYSKDRQAFSNAVLAEVMDSCYCSDRSRSVFRDQFPATWNAADCRIQ